MKVLIIGGMGLIGGAITEAAVKANHDVTVLSRRAPFEKWRDLSVTYLQGNWKDDAFAEEAVADYFDVIVDTQIFDEKQILRSMGIINNHCKHFIYISTDSVYAHPSKNLSEDREIDLEDLHWDYGIKKRKAELYLLSHSDEFSFRWSVIRPTLTFGNTRIPVGFSSKRGTYNLIDRIEEQKPIIRFDNPVSRHSLCHVSIFGEASVRLFLNEKAYGRFFHISDDYSYTYDEIFETIEAVVGKKGRFVYSDTKLLKKYSPSVYDEMIYDKNPEFTLDNSNIKALCPELNFHPNLDEIMYETIMYLRSRKEVGEDDSDYDKLTDLLLMKGNYVDSESKQIVSDYLEQLPESYKNEIANYGKNARKIIIVNGIKKRLSPIKHMILNKNNGR